MQLTLFDDIDTASKLWRRLECDGICSFFQTYDWLSQWQLYLGVDDVTPRIVAVTDDDGRYLALLPMGTRVNHWGCGLVWLGGDVSPYQGPVITRLGATLFDQTMIETVFHRLQQDLFSFDYVDLDRQPAYFGDYVNPFAGFRSERTSLQSHDTSLIGDWQTYYAGKRSGKTRSKERRRLAKLKEAGNVEFFIASSPEQLNPLIDALILEKSRQLRALGVKDVFDTPATRDLFRALALQQAAAGRIQISALMLDTKPIAINYAAIHAREYHGVFMCYMENANTKLGPGTILIHKILEWCFENGIERFDFSLGDQHYKTHWCERENPLFRSIWPTTLRGSFYTRSLNAALSLKTVVKSSSALTFVARTLPGLRRKY